MGSAVLGQLLIIDDDLGRDSDRSREQLAVPFYLKMMGGNARRNGARMPALAIAGRTATPRDVAVLMGDHWRTKATGAWFAVMHDDGHVTSAVLDAVTTGCSQPHDDPVTPLCHRKSGG